jgi:BlaI family transcriptional regulator, penicillinase repressor
VRSILRILAEKGLITHREDGPRYVYLPARSRQSAREEALRHLVRTYFEGSAEQAMTALLRLGEAGVSETDLRRLRSAVRKARNSGR